MEKSPLETAAVDLAEAGKQEGEVERDVGFSFGNEAEV